MATPMPLHCGKPMRLVGNYPEQLVWRCVKCKRLIGRLVN